MPDENDIQNLLRLKRYEQPGPEYFDRFLRDFQHRQRAELLRLPLWKIALHRVEAFFSEPSLPQLAYAGATVAVLLVAGVTSLNIISGGNNNSSSIAQAGVAPVPVRQVAQTQGGSMVLDPRIRLADWNTFPNQTVGPRTQTAAMPPHYVIDARPASYEPPSSF